MLCRQAVMRPVEERRKEGRKEGKGRQTDVGVVPYFCACTHRIRVIFFVLLFTIVLVTFITLEQSIKEERFHSIKN